MTIEQIKNKLKDRNLRAVAKAVGVHYNTLYHIATGSNANARASTLAKITTYLERA
jgi:DNA-binding Xre family transcriptional regulator